MAAILQNRPAGVQRPDLRGLAAWWARRSVRRTAGRVALYIVLSLGAVSMLLPLYYLLNMALSTPSALGKFPPDIIPKPPMISNFWKGWKEYYDFSLLLKNTLIITIGALIGQLLSCTLVAYGFARLRFPGRSFWFIVLLATMMLPGQVTMVPVYYIFAKLRWVNTFKPLVVPAYFGSAFYVFLLRQFFMTLPRELDDAARIDGCGYLRTLTQILLPLCRPALTAVAIFSFVGHWSDYMGPLIYLNSPDKFTIVLGTTYLTIAFGHQFVHMGYVMAVTTLSVMPVLLIYLFAQRAFIEGITLSGVRG